jgi:hypothetical protein
MQRLIDENLMPEDLIGAFCLDRHLTKDHVDTCIAPAYAALKALMAEHDPDADWTIETEVEVQFPGVPGSYGTTDVLAASPNVTLVCDFKFGSGIPVRALYEDPEGDVINAQLLFYAASSMNTRKDLFKGRHKIIVSVIQPRVAEPVTQTEVSRAEIKTFEKGLISTFVEAMGPQPRMAKGDHCRFAACRTICPLHIGPLIDLSRIRPVHPTLQAAAIREPTPYGVYLSKAMDFITQIEPLAAEIRRQMHEFMDAGGIVPHYKLVAKRAYRKWIDEAETVAEMANLGLKVDEIWESNVRSPAQMEKVLKPLGLKLPDDLTEAVSSGTTIAPDGDPRQPEQLGVLEAQLTHALKAIR